MLGHIMLLFAESLFIRSYSRPWPLIFDADAIESDTMEQNYRD